MYPLGKSALIHVSSMYPAQRGCLSIVLPLCAHPTNSNGIICYDLSVSPEVLIAATGAEVHHLVFTAAARLKKNEKRIPLKTIHINRCPAISPLVTLTDDNALRLGLDKDLCQEHLKQLQQASGIVEKIVDAYASHEFATMTDPDFMLYQGEFFGRSDVTVMAELRSSKPERLADFEGQFQDDRLDEMLFRYRARNYPELLDESDLARWKQFKLSRWKGGSVVDEAIDRTNTLISEKGELPYLADLRKYLENIKFGVLS
jgi:exodeoxyribonuclease-1